MKRVLSIDGGGLRGLIPARVLADLERRTGRPVQTLFDLMAGTSTGGLLALALAQVDAAGQPVHSAEDLVRLYRERGGEIFPRGGWQRFKSLGGLLNERYDAGPLEALLRQVLGEAPMPQVGVPVMVTAYDIAAREPVFLKSWHPEHREVPQRAAARATSAAPSYFEPALVNVGGVPRALIDGGVFINSPAVSACAEAHKLFAGAPQRLLSLGTGELTEPIDPAKAQGWGLAGWLRPLLGCVFDGVADAAHYQLSHWLGPHYLRLQTRLLEANDAMDDASPANIAALDREADRLIAANSAALDVWCGELTG